MPTLYYRYVSDAEKEFIEQNRMILSKAGSTWFTPNRYETASDARRYLALPTTQPWMIGPIPADEMPDFDAAALRPVAPANGESGGGTECATSKPVYLYGVVRLP
jgi:hypothetical protein